MQRAMGLLALAVAIGMTAPSWAGEQKATDRQRDAAASQRIEVPKDCADIKAGANTGGSTTESAARKDCEASRHLGADRGTSSGTGSGKMGSGSGPR